MLPFHQLLFIPVEMTEKDACYCCRVLLKQGKNINKNRTQKNGKGN